MSSISRPARTSRQCSSPLRSVPALAQHLAHAPDRGHVPVPQPRRRASGRARGAGELRARQDPFRRARRGEPRARDRRARLRDRSVAQRGVLGERLDPSECLLGPPAARRRRPHHAVQLPGDVPDVDVPPCNRGREYLCAQAVREGPVDLLDSPSSSPRRVFLRACSTSSTATRWQSTRSSSIRASLQSALSARLPWPRHVYENAAAKGNARQGRHGRWGQGERAGDALAFPINT